MTKITNTTQDDHWTKLAHSLPGGIEAQEAAGQRELVHSDRLPTDTGYSCTDADFEALGFTFGPPDPDDPMFRPATLPAGWSRKGSGHSMWSHIVDERGLDRVSIFYKAAFYDRSAHMGIVNVGGTVATEALYDEACEKTVPWELLTEAERADAVAALHSMTEKVKQYPDIYGKHADRIKALLETVP
jgi:hypothetical protein